PWEGSSPANLASPPAVQPLPDVMEDMLAMVGSGHLLATRQDAEPVPAFATSSLVLPVPASKSSASTQQPSGEHFMGWLRHGLQSRKLILNDAKALVHTVDDTVF
ncbi:DNA-binding domain-containing protein, partial [Pseudomonas aeruginosa]|nr:DNA-binding domain-containing protein [Pseudomonas aeruginosa]